jgi:WD40 repeat protein
LDDNRIFASDDDGNITQWDMDTGRKIGAWAAHAGPAGSMALAPDGTTLVSGGDDDKTIAIWDAPTGKLRSRLTGHADAVDGLAFAPDGRRFASISTDNTVRLWDTTEAKEVWKASLPFAGIRETFSPDGNTLAVMCIDGTLHLLHSIDGKQYLAIDTKHTGYGASRPVAFGAEGKDVFIGTGNTVCRWDARSGVRLFPRGEAGDSVSLDEVACLAVSPAQCRMYTLADPPTARVLVWDLTQKCLMDVWPLSAGPFAPSSLQLSANSKQLLVGSAYGASVLDTEAGQRRVLLPGVRPQQPWFWTGGDRAVICGQYDAGAFAIYDLKGGAPRVTGDGGKRAFMVQEEPESARQQLLAVSSDGQCAAVKTSGNHLAVWDIRDPRLVAEMDLNVAGFGCMEAVFLPNGTNLLLADAGNRLCLWDWSPPHYLGATPEQLARWVNELGDADFMTRAGATTRLIDCGPAAEGALAESDRRDREVVDRAAKIRLEWKRRATPQHEVGEILDLHQTRFGRLAVHPDGRHWATILVPRTVAPTEVVLGEVTPMGPRVVRRLNDEHHARSLVFSADGKALYVGNADTTISVWRVAP